MPLTVLANPAARTRTQTQNKIAPDKASEVTSAGIQPRPLQTPARAHPVHVTAPSHNASQVAVPQQTATGSSRSLADSAIAQTPITLLTQTVLLSLTRPGCGWLLLGDTRLLPPFLCCPCMPVALVACMVTGNKGSLSPAPMDLITTALTSGCELDLLKSWICRNLKRRLVCTFKVAWQRQQGSESSQQSASLCRSNIRGTAQASEDRRPRMKCAAHSTPATKCSPLSMRQHHTQ